MQIEVNMVFPKYTHQNQQCKDILKVLFGKMLKTSPQEADLLLCFPLCEKTNLEDCYLAIEDKLTTQIIN